MERERKTIGLMVKMYCASSHAKNSVLCPQCRELLDYAYLKIEKCSLRSTGNKPACSVCLIHCYNPQMREKIRQIMKFCGPRMALSHPVLAMWHFVNKLWQKNLLKFSK